ncbi:hypothetical protein [Ekhidna sp.]|uniref:hypothetical protein n=1 Tax=Ekhidna sp. TaxID=2608089 RepID=UPI003CCBDF06
MKKIAILLILPFLFSCEDEKQTSSDDLLEQMNAVYEEIQSVIEVSCSSTSQCIATPIGVKPCGGPTRFIVHSNTTDQNELDSLVDQYNGLNARYNEVNNLGSDCSIETAPEIECVTGECQEVTS